MTDWAEVAERLVSGAAQMLDGDGVSGPPPVREGESSQLYIAVYRMPLDGHHDPSARPLAVSTAAIYLDAPKDTQHAGVYAIARALHEWVDTQ